LPERIDELKGKLDAEPVLSDGELDRLNEQFMIDYIYNSNAVDDNTLTLSETVLVIMEGVAIHKKPLRCHIQAVGHKHAYEYVVDVAKDTSGLSEDIIKEIHSLALLEDYRNKGKYREIQVPIQMENILKAYAEDTRHPIIKIADFHIKFEQVHPFVDGNGRTGRLIMNLELIKAGYAPVNIKFKDRDSYMSCFKDAVTSDDTLKFTKMMANYELEELEHIYALSQEKLEVQRYKKENGLECQPTKMEQILTAKGL